jgi:hypothetical protein
MRVAGETDTLSGSPGGSPSIWRMAGVLDGRLGADYGV